MLSMMRAEPREDARAHRGVVELARVELREIEIVEEAAMDFAPETHVDDRRRVGGGFGRGRRDVRRRRHGRLGARSRANDDAMRPDPNGRAVRNVRLVAPEHDSTGDRSVRRNIPNAKPPRMREDDGVLPRDAVVPDADVAVLVAPDGHRPGGRDSLRRTRPVFGLDGDFDVHGCLGSEADAAQRRDGSPITGGTRLKG